MPLTGNPERIASDLQATAVKFQLTPHRVVKVGVKYAPNRWEVQIMEQTPGTDKWEVVSGPVVCNKAVEVSQILKELTAEVEVETVSLDIGWGDGTLQHFPAASLDAI